MTITVVQRSSWVWKVCIFLSIIGLPMFFIGFAMPHLIYGDYSDDVGNVNLNGSSSNSGSSDGCTEIGAGLWEYCSRDCSEDDWECDEWSHEGDHLIASRVLQISASIFAIIGCFLIFISRASRKRQYCLLLATLLHFLATITGGAGIGLFLTKQLDDFDDAHSSMADSDAHVDWAGALSIASSGLFFLTTVFCFVDYRLSRTIAAYDEV